jgi:tRNA-modifying protein YgfZ
MTFDSSSSEAISSGTSQLPISQFFEGLEIGFFELEGKDAEDFLHRQLSNEIRNLKVGSGVPVCLLNREGRILLYFTLWKTETGYSAIVPEQQRSHFIPLLDRVIFREEIRLTDRKLEFCPLVIAGVQAGEVLHKVGASSVPGVFESSQFNLANTSMKVCCMDWLVDPCFLLVCPADETTKVTGELQAVGCVKSDLESFHSYRIEKGSPWPGYEVDETMIPFECGLGDVASLTKGCYVGQEIIARIHNLGKPPRILRGLVFQGSTPPERGVPVHHEKVEVGKVLSASWSRNLDKPIATTSIRVKYSAVGTTVTVGGNSAVVEEFPLINRASS